MTTLDDPRFERTLKLSEAYRILEAFIVQYSARGESSTVALMTDIGIVRGGTRADPAQLDDFLKCSEAVLSGANP